jgi:hypothetical protein
MNTPELIYQTIQFFFSTLWIYLGLLLLIITIRGDVTRALTGIKEFFQKTAVKYREKRDKETKFNEMKQRVVKEEWKESN